jgi:hypothetical protein
VFNLLMDVCFRPSSGHHARRIPAVLLEVGGANGIASASVIILLTVGLDGVAS